MRIRSVRYHRRSGEEVVIQPREGRDEPALRWNGDAPLFVSPHSPTRLYFAANGVFRSDHRGDTWTTLSGQERLHLHLWKRRRPHRVSRAGGAPLGGDRRRLRAEDLEEDPYLLFMVTDDQGRAVRRITAEPRSGMQRVAWDLRYPTLAPIDLGGPACPTPSPAGRWGPWWRPGRTG